jgi:HD-GYP domain-containing protein (c-di-GMP phosphodiesterase class II)
MKLVKVSNLVPGIVIAKDVFQDTGVLVLNEGTILTAELITKLKYWGFTEVMVEDPQPSLKEQQEALIAPKIAAVHDRMVGITQSLMNADNVKDADPFMLRGMVGDIESQLDLDTNLLLNLSHLKTYDFYLFSHVVNVCVLSVIIGREMKMSSDELKELGMSALLHDFGMTKIDQAIYNQESKLTPEQWQEIRKHPDYGFELLSGNQFSTEVLQGIRQHHERINGSGYPLGLKGPEIGQFGKVIAIADVYDACISPRKHRKRYTPYEALKILLGDSHLFEIKILKAFIASMAIYPIGSFIRLNTGEIAKVIGINHGAPFRPEIRIYFDSSEHKLDESVRINLVEEEYTQTYIQDTLESAEMDRIYQLMDE